MPQRIDSTEASVASTEPPLALRIAAVLQFLVGISLLGSGVVWATRTQEAAAVSAAPSATPLASVILFAVIPVAAGLAAIVIGVAMCIRAQAWSWWATLALQTAYLAVVVPTTLANAAHRQTGVPDALRAAWPAVILLLLFVPASLRVVAPAWRRPPAAGPQSHE